MTRGLKNNNPLNIRRNNTKWQGLSPVQRDRAFFSFIAPEWGYRAALMTLRTYQRKHYLHSIEQMISRWAPPSENHTEIYIRTVSTRTGIPADKPVNLYDREVCVSLMEAMCWVENGVPGDREVIGKGYDLCAR